MKKRILALLLALAMTFVLCACGGGDGDDGDKGPGGGSASDNGGSSTNLSSDDAVAFFRDYLTARISCDADGALKAGNFEAFYTMLAENGLIDDDEAEHEISLTADVFEDICGQDAKDRFEEQYGEGWSVEIEIREIDELDCDDCADRVANHYGGDLKVNAAYGIYYTVIYKFADGETDSVLGSDEVFNIEGIWVSWSAVQ